MPIVAQCPKCAKRYKVADNTVGKQVKCQNCQNPFVIAAAAPEMALAGAATGSRPGPAASGGGAATNRHSELERRFGLKPIPPSTNQVFPEQEFRRPANRPHPLSNHVVQDPGFAHVTSEDYYTTQIPKEQSMHDYMAEIEREEGITKKKKSTSSPLVLYLVSAIGPFLFAILGIIIALTSGEYEFGWWACIIGFAVLSLLVNATMYSAIEENGDSGDWIMFMFVPFYQPYYIIVNWSYMMHPFLAGIVLFFSFVCSMILFQVMAFMLNLNPLQAAG